MYWMQMSDFYDWPHIQVYDDFDDLKRKLLNADFQSIHKKMREEHEIRGLQLNRKWCDVIEKIRNYKSKL
jgi:hypothetical protein